MAETEERELCSSAYALGGDASRIRASPSNPSRQMCMNYVLVVKVIFKKLLEREILYARS